MRDELQKEHILKTVEYFKTNSHGYADISMRYGKTRYALEVLKIMFPTYDPTILICYPNNILKESWQKECIKWNYNNPNITYVNFSSLKNYYTGIWDFVIVDEFHGTSDNERDYAKIIINNDPYTKCLALSGSVTSKTKELWGLKRIVKYSINEGIRDGVVSDYNITVHLVALDDTIKTANSKGKMLTEKQKHNNYSYVITKMIRDGKNFKHLALSRNRLSMSSIGKKKALLKILSTLKNKRVIIFCGLQEVADNLGIPSYHSKSKDTTNIDAFQNKKFNHLALVEAGKVGVTYKDLDCVILLNFVGNSASNSQALTRAIQLDYKKKKADLRILCLNEENELKKIKEGLSILDKTKIKYL